MISQEAQEKLDRLSLVSFVSIKNSFVGLYMTQQLRRWFCVAEIRIGEHRKEFSNLPHPFSSDLSDAILNIYDQVVEYIESQPDLRQYWED